MITTKYQEIDYCGYTCELLLYPDDSTYNISASDFYAIRKRIIDHLGVVSDFWNDGNDPQARWAISDIVPVTFMFRSQEDAIIAKLLIY